MTAVMPTNMGAYTIERTLGTGGMGQVYLAFDERLQRRVAIKCLHPDKDNPRFAQRLKQEAKRLARLNHPGIVQVYDVIDEPDRFAIVMEYVQGKTLKQYLADTPLALTQKIQWCLSISAALLAAHRAGIIHRDLKMDNILVDAAGEIKLSDFGISKGGVDAVAGDTTQEGVISGSYLFMAPEQALGQTVDERSDLYSLGVVFYYLFCGCHPFGDTEQPMGLVQKVLNGQYIPADQVCPTLPPPLVTLLAQLLSRSPSRRPLNAHQVITMLEQVLKPSADETLHNHSVATIDTTPLDFLPSHPTTANHSQFMLKRHSLKKPPLMLMGFGLIIFIALGFLGWPMSTDKVVAVIPPIMENAETIEDSRLINASAYQAVLGAMFDREAVTVIDSHEILSLSGTPHQKARAVDADEVIGIRLSCNSTHCDVNLSRSDSQSMALLWQTRLNVAHHHLIEMNEVIQLALQEAYPQHPWRGQSQFMPSDLDYRQYLDIQQAIIRQGPNESFVQPLIQLSQRTPEFLPLHQLLSDLYLGLYWDSYDPQWLKANTAHLSSTAHRPSFGTGLERSYFKQALATQSYQEAEDWLQKLEENHRGSSLVDRLRADLLFDSGQPQQALEAIEAAISKRQSWYHYIVKARLLWQTGDIPSAERTATQALTLAPDAHQALRLIAAIRSFSGDFVSAADYYRRLSVLSPDNVAVWSDLGAHLLMAQQFAQAESALRQALSLDQNDAGVYLNLADSVTLQGREAEARDLYQKVLDHLQQTTHKDWFYYALQAQALAHLNQHELAITAVQTMLSIAHDDGQVAYIAALVYQICGEQVSAKVNKERAIAKGIAPDWFDLPWFTH